MTGRSKNNIKKVFLSMLILSGLTVSLLSQDTQISGKINVYKRVEAIGPGLDNVTLNNVDSIAPGDTVLLIQMQGVQIVTTNSPTYGYAVQDTIGIPGGYEFLLVQSVNGGTGNVVFTNNILNSFDIRGNVQLVRVPYYNTATVTGKLTAKSWDNTEKTGGVLAMIVGRKLKLDADIDVSGTGFKGGKDTIGNGECVYFDYSANSHSSYPRSWYNAGYKGEGIANYDEFGVSLTPQHTKGFGINLTGGGGGNGKYSGGGGGSNRGLGGTGVPEKYDILNIDGCSSVLDGGTGGNTIFGSFVEDGIFFGGGGGSSTHAVGSLGSDGGNGGGIVIIIADTISGNRNFIRSSGTTAGDPNGDGGSGGGGAGGSVVLSLQSFSDVPSDSLKISVNGGDGGVNTGGFGDGGGGGGGLLWVSTAGIPGKVPVDVDYGAPGPGTPTDGFGEIKVNFTPLLNGFLFNSIRSVVTGNQVDSICSNVAFGQISGTIPVGGVTPHTFLWESSTTSESAGFSAAPGANTGQNYTPPALLTQTTWFRRVVTDSDTPALIDYSKPVMVIVQQAITGNIVGKDTTICFNQDPITLVPLNAGPSNGSAYNYYNYRWVQNLTNTDWNTSPDAAGTNNNADYNPPALTSTTYYQRVVTSGRCVDYSTTVTIDVLPLITGNIMNRPDSVICEGSLFNNLSTTAAGGGDLSYNYLWEESLDASSWLPATGTNDATDYSADTSTFAVIENRYYRRVVYSGPDSVCINNSSPIELIRYHYIENNSIADNQTICSGDIPLALSGSTPAMGSGIYNYAWQDSSKVSDWATRDNGDFSFSPPALTDTTWYRRIVTSSKCTDVSPKIRIDVHKPIVNVISLQAGATDTTICNGADPHPISGAVATGGTDIPGDYAYQWFESSDQTTWTSAGTGITYDPPALTDTTYYRRQVISGECTHESNIITVTVLPLISNNIISADQTVCYGTVPAVLTGAVLAGGAGAGTYSFLWEESPDGLAWSGAEGSNLSETYQPSALTVPMKYRRTVKSGDADCCIDTSNEVDIGIFDLPTGTITSTSDTTICEGSQVRLRISLTGASAWNVTYNENTVPTTVNNITGSDVTLIATPVTGTALSSYTYSLASVEDQNGCFATSLSGTRNADVYKMPVADAGQDKVNCGSTVTLSATPSYGAGTWYFPAEVITPAVNNPSVTVTIDSTKFVNGKIALKFIWEEVNWQCRSKDSLIVSFDERVNNINAGPDTTLFSFDNIIKMVADPLQSWETGIWTVVSGTGEFVNDGANDTQVTGLSMGMNKFLWTVTNGTCNNNDMMSIDVYDIVIPKGFSPNNDPNGYNNTFIIRGLDLPNQYAELKILNSAGTEIFTTSNLKSDDDWIDWDGTNSQGVDLPEGTYYYLLKLTSKGNGKVDKRSGFIILKRY